MQYITDNIYILVVVGMTGSGLLAACFILLQVRSQNKLFRQRRKLDELAIAHQRELLRAVLEHQEIERRRIGQNLHDDVGGALAVLRINAAALSERNGTLLLQLDRICENVRNIAYALSPQGVELLGLWGAVEDILSALPDGNGMETRFDCPDSVRLYPWRSEVAIPLFRIIQELIANTIKHADASKIEIETHLSGDFFQMTYRDNGSGSGGQPQRQGLGIANIISRLEMLGAVYQFEHNQGYNFKMEIEQLNKLDTASTVGTG